MVSALRLYMQSEKQLEDLFGPGPIKEVRTGRSTDYAAAHRELARYTEGLSVLVPQVTAAIGALGSTAPDKNTLFAHFGSAFEDEVLLHGRTLEESLALQSIAYQRGMDMLLAECRTVLHVLDTGDVSPLRAYLDDFAEIWKEELQGFDEEQAQMIGVFSYVGSGSVSICLPSDRYRPVSGVLMFAREPIPQTLLAAQDNSKAALTDFLVEVFGEKVDAVAIGDYLQERGDVTRLEKCTGGNSAQAVVAVGSSVSKLYKDQTDAVRQCDDLRRLAGLGGLMPRVTSDITKVGELYICDMENIDGRNLFAQTHLQRLSTMDETALRVQKELATHSRYAEAREVAIQSGVSDLFEYLDHHMFALGMFHKVAQTAITRTLPIGPTAIGGLDHETRLSTVEAQNGDLRRQIEELLAPLERHDVLAKFVDVKARLQEGPLYVCHGNYEPKNTTVGGGIVDPHTMLSKLYVDGIRFCSAPELNLPLSLVMYFAATRYNQHRQTHDQAFAADRSLQESMYEGNPLAMREISLRRVAAMQRRDLTQPGRLEKLDGLVQTTVGLYDSSPALYALVL
jgi:hypothetical protein